MRKILFIVFITCCLLSCRKEIDFDYNEVSPIVVVEGRVTNEGTRVTITKSRSVSDSVKGNCLTGAVVVVGGNGFSETVDYDPKARCYHSTMRGRTGESYHLSVDFEGHHYEGEATMPIAAPVLSSEFVWFSVIDERMVVYELWARDANPEERNYYWYRMDRISHHPHFMGRQKSEPYRWGVFSNRGNPPGLIYRDIWCMSERMADEDEEDNWDRILYEGDTVTFQLMSIDRGTYDYFTSLRAGQRGGANPVSNLTGGCMGYFTAGSLTNADTLVFGYDSIKAEPSLRDFLEGIRK